MIFLDMKSVRNGMRKKDIKKSALKQLNVALESRAVITAY